MVDRKSFKPSFRGAQNILDEPTTSTIAHADYLGLLRDRERLNYWKAMGVLDEDNNLGLFSSDPEVAIFMAVRFNSLTIHELVEAVTERFGESRTPAVTAIRRFGFRFAKFFHDLPPASDDEPMPPPHFHEAQGFKLVTIPLAEYIQLLDVRRAYDKAREMRRLDRRILERYPKVADFLRGQYGKETMASALRLCEERFGSYRTPSVSTLLLFWMPLRIAEAKRNNRKDA